MSKKMIIGLIVVAFLIGAGIFYMENFGGPSFKGLAIGDKTPSVTLLLMDGQKSMYENKEISPGATNTTLLRFGFRAQNEDAVVKGFTLKAKGASIKTIDDTANLGLYREKDGILVASVPQFTSCKNNECSVDFTGLNVALKANQSDAIFLIKANVPVNSIIGDDFQVRLYSADVNATLANGGEVAKFGNVAGSRFKIAASTQTAGKLSVVLLVGPNGSPTTSQLVPIGTTGKTYFAFKLVAQNEPVKITSLKLTAAGSYLNKGDIKNIALYKDADLTPFATALEFDDCVENVCTYAWSSPDNILAMPIDPAKPVSIIVKADVSSTGFANLGDSFTFKINDIGTDLMAKGAYTNVAFGLENKTAGMAAPTASAVIVPFSVSVASDDSIIPPSNLDGKIVFGPCCTNLARFKIANNGSSPITITNISLRDGGTHTGFSTTYSLYMSDDDARNYTGNLLTVTDSDTVDFGVLKTPIKINGNASRILTVQTKVPGEIKPDDTFALSVPVSGILYNVAESNLGYTANPVHDKDLEDIVNGLPVEGKAAAKMVTVK
ncbi:MAG: hypothetical protein UT33_C0006G0070 [Candidatus Peregrinibacteria bacterium GW2011_GWC2_39_14]|nr:MAG: hypothetical protein UT33_C0006G0070 [Candidatus Peregrinibacteria bacterium GW2011_GWC2_39_14]